MNNSKRSERVIMVSSCCAMYARYEKDDACALCAESVARINRSVESYRELPCDLIVTKLLPHYKHDPTPTFAKWGLERQGIPTNRIVGEVQGGNPYEEAWYAVQLCRQKGYGTIELVTSRFYLDGKGKGGYRRMWEALANSCGIAFRGTAVEHNLLPEETVDSYESTLLKVVSLFARLHPRCHWVVMQTINLLTTDRNRSLNHPKYTAT